MGAPVYRCREHGVYLADAPPVDHPDEYMVASLTANAEAVARFRRFMDLAQEYLPAGRLHDVGCGTGDLMREAARRGFEVQGNDVVRAAASAVAAAGMRAWAGDLPALDLPPASVDAVTSFCVVPNHLPDPTPNLQAVRRLLRPGGWFFVELPGNGPYRLANEWLWRLTRRPYVLTHLANPGGHVSAFSPASIRATLERHGFEVVAVRPFRVPVRTSLTRYRTRLERWAIAPVAYALDLLARVTRRPNHIFVVARLPEGTGG